MENEDNVRHRIHFLKMKRETFKLHIKKLLTWLDENQMFNIDRSELRKKRDQLQKQFHRFVDDQSELEQYEHVGTVEAEGHSITEQYCVAMARANAILDDLEQSTNGEVVLPGPSTSAMNDYRLEATFNGKHEDWPKFKEDFQRFLRANSDLGETLKLQKLRSCLSESMKVAIDPYRGNENNFKLAWEMLLAAYDKTYTLSQALRVIDTPAMLDDLEQSTNGEVVLPGPSTSAMNVYRPEATFNGKYVDWPKFKEDFQRFLLANCDLRSFLFESMKAATESYIGNDNNFKFLWEMLLSVACDKTYEFIMSHALRVIDTPAMLDDSTNSIQNFMRQVEPYMRGLEIFVKSRTDIPIIPLISFMVTNILKYFKSHILQSWTKDSKPNNHEKPETGPQKRTMESSSSMCRSKPTSPPTKRRVLLENCHFCNKESLHPHYCPVLQLMTPSARRVEIRNAGMCEICLRKNHSTNECVTDERCRKCQGKHNTWLHEDC